MGADESLRVYRFGVVVAFGGLLFHGCSLEVLVRTWIRSPPQEHQFWHPSGAWPSGQADGAAGRLPG